VMSDVINSFSPSPLYDPRVRYGLNRLVIANMPRAGAKPHPIGIRAADHVFATTLIRRANAEISPDVHAD